MHQLSLFNESSPKHYFCLCSYIVFEQWCSCTNCLGINFFYSPIISIFMTDKQLENMTVFRKATRCATLYELLAEELGLNPLGPETTWKDIAKAYNVTMEEAHKLQQTEDDENTND